MAPPPCSTCSRELSTKSPGLSCSGPCKKPIHFACANLPIELAAYMKQCRRLYWKCEDCQNFSSAFNISDLKSLIDSKFNEFRDEIENKFSLLKAELSRQSEQIIKEQVIKNHLEPITRDLKNIKPIPSNQSSYANVLTKSEAKCIIRPKVQNQQVSITKAEILDKIDPLNSGITINEVKSSKDGGLIIGCGSKPECEKLTNLVNKSLASNYDVHTLKLWRPRISVVGMTKKLDGDMLIKCLKSQNSHLFAQDAEISFIDISPLKKKPSLFQAKIEVDISTYKVLLDSKHLVIGLDACSIYDAVSIVRCFKCNEFNHSSRHCKKTSCVCPICAENHEIKCCNIKSPNLYKCINCIGLMNRSGVTINCQHAAWDSNNCTAYKKAVAKFKKDLFGIEHE